MPKDIKPVTDPDNPEWTKEKFARSIGFNELPADLREKLSSLSKTRGPQKTPTKQPVTMRLSPDVLTALRAKGRGWQTLVDNALREQFVKGSR